MSNKTQKLSDTVKISHQYQRSIRLDSDIGRKDAITGFICHKTAKNILENISKQINETNQRSFTWTGPFGGGKSSLALALASSVLAQKDIRNRSRDILLADKIANFNEVFGTQKGWLVIPLVGRRTSIVSELGQAFQKAQNKQTRKNYSPNTLIGDLVESANSPDHDGVLVIIDEMGKFLEATAAGKGDDVYFFQELAEAAARAKGKLVIIGILHQSFSRYGSKLGKETRDDWSKVQGRYVDLPFVAGNDEALELVSKAIESGSIPAWADEPCIVISESIRSRRPSAGTSLRNLLENCWPLHPAMAALLPTISKRQFGQNERSIFSFLASAEPFGFSSYLENTPSEKFSWYRPQTYWDYLKTNLEPAILASSDGHRWSQAVESIERTEAKSSDSFLIDLIKCIAIIDLFRQGSGLSANEKTLHSVFTERSKLDVQKALKALSDLRVAIYKKHIDSWSVFEGSDFDIDLAVSEALTSNPEVDYKRLSRMMGIHPVVAKRHYHETGTMRWMDLSIHPIQEIDQLVHDYKPQQGEFGKFIIALPAAMESQKKASQKAKELAQRSPWPILVGIPYNHSEIEQLSAELNALESVKDRHELQGDAVARREVHARLASINTTLTEHLQSAITNCIWYDGNSIIERVEVTLSPIASDLADEIFSKSPLIWSELANRESLSSNSVKARRDLLHAMIEGERKENLGIEGYPAERGLYETLLKSTSLHAATESSPQFSPPVLDDDSRLYEVWEETKSLFNDPKDQVRVSDIYSIWGLPPYGIKKGIMPVIFTAFLITHKSNLAIYKDGIFIPRLSDADIDEILQDETRFTLRWIIINEDRRLVLQGIADILKSAGSDVEIHDPLEAARGLVSLVLSLPQWTQKTHKISEATRSIRDILLRAKDPHKVLFVDLAALLGVSDGASYVEALKAPILELSHAYPKMLEQTCDFMLNELDAPLEDLKSLRERADNVAGVTGDLKQDSFATRLITFDGSKDSIEGMLSLAASKPPRDWIDRDIDSALLEISSAALRFRQAEVFSTVKNRKPKTEAFAVAIGTGANLKLLSKSFSVTDRYKAKVEEKANAVAGLLENDDFSNDLILAILAKAGMKLIGEQE
ncbi:ATP-binding protein [Pseudomonas sp. GZD-209]|uniref:ATP-binding protein n=1 Tax=Pseudomonas sp. GZD-209 TaxID=3404807 RepID=UPI003BB71961